ncbi:MAG: phage holin family protein [Patescibacteria group bacterium]
MRLILKLIITALAILLVAYLVPGVTVASFWTALFVALILGLLNLTLKPILIILTLPINLITLGLFTFVINALLFWLVGTFIEGFAVEGFVPAFVGALIVSIVGWLGHLLITDND